MSHVQNRARLPRLKAQLSPAVDVAAEAATHKS
jgi:hypothetical protein